MIPQNVPAIGPGSTEKFGMRLVLRIIGTWLLGLALILMIIDGTKSLAANALVMTSLGDTWNSLNAGGLAALRGFIDTRFFGPVLEPILTAMLFCPGFVALGIPGVLLVFFGRSRRSRRFVRQDRF